MRAGRGYDYEVFKGTITSGRGDVAKIGSVFYFTVTLKTEEKDYKSGRVPITLIKYSPGGFDLST